MFDEKRVQQCELFENSFDSLPLQVAGHDIDIGFSGVTDLLSGTCQYRGGVSFSPVNLVSRTCQYGPFREHHLGV